MGRPPAFRTRNTAPSCRTSTHNVKRRMERLMTTASYILTAIAASATLGGLLVVIVSVIAYFQIENKVDQRFQQKYAEHQDALNQQSAQWATGIKLWTQATMTTNLDQATSLMKEALDAWPSAPGARTDMLRRLYNATEQAYILDLIPGQRDQVINHYVNSGDDTPHITYPLFEYWTDCLEWLTLCDAYEPSIDPTWLKFTGSKIYAMHPMIDRMFQSLESLPLDFERPDDDSVLVLLSAIHNTRDLLRLTQWWTMRFAESLLADPAQVIPMKSQTSRFQYWLVVAKRLPDLRGIAIARYGDTRWQIIEDVVLRQKQPVTFDNLERLMDYVNERWILLRPISWVTPEHL